MKLSDWARQNGVHPKTALRWFDRGILPVPARKVGPRTILVEVPSGGDDAVALYARVSSHDQRHDLDVNSQSVGNTPSNVQVECRMAVAALQAPDPPFGATGKVRQLALREAAHASEPPDTQTKLAGVHLRSSAGVPLSPTWSALAATARDFRKRAAGGGSSTGVSFFSTD